MRTIRPLHLVAGVAALGLFLTACSPPDTGADDDAAAPAATEASEIPDTPSEPVDLNILDVGGVLRLAQPAIESFAADNPEVIGEVTFETGAAPDVVGTLKPQVETGNLSIDMVLTGNDALSAGIAEDLWIPVVEDFGDRISNMDGYIAPAADMQELSEGYGVQIGRAHV